MTETETRYWVRFTWPNDEADAHCLSVPRVGEHVQLPGKNQKYVVAEVLHRLMQASDGSFVQLIGVDLVPLAGGGTDAGQ